MMMAKSKIN